MRPPPATRRAGPPQVQRSPAPVPPTSPTGGASPTASSPVRGRSFRTKRVEFLGKSVDIIMQDTNGPCPLLAAANVLLLSGAWRSFNDSASDGKGLKRVGVEELITRLSNHLLDANANRHSKGETERANLEKGLEDALRLLPKLKDGMDVNCRFESPTSFEFTPELAVFDMLGVLLVHGWLPDKEDAPVVDALKNLSYNSAIERLILFRECCSAIICLAVAIALGQDTVEEECPKPPESSIDTLGYQDSGSGTTRPPLISLESRSGAPSSDGENGRRASDAAAEPVKFPDDDQSSSLPSSSSDAVNTTSQVAVATSSSSDACREICDAPNLMDAGTPPFPESAKESEDVPPFPESQATVVTDGDSPDESLKDPNSEPVRGASEDVPAEKDVIPTGEGEVPRKQDTISPRSSMSQPREAPPLASQSDENKKPGTTAEEVVFALAVAASSGKLDELKHHLGLHPDYDVERLLAIAQNHDQRASMLLDPSQGGEDFPTPTPDDVKWAKKFLSPLIALSKEGVPASNASLEKLLLDGPSLCDFLESSASQMTLEGIHRLHQTVGERQLAVLFRNCHFSVVFRHDGLLYLLLTDEGYADIPSVLWELLDGTDGASGFYGPDFRPAVPLKSSGPTTYADAASVTQTEKDRRVAQQLQQQYNQQRQRRPPSTAAMDGGARPLPKKNRKEKDKCVVM